MDKNWKKEKKENSKIFHENQERWDKWKGDYWHFSDHAIKQCEDRNVGRDEVIEAILHGKDTPHPDYDNQRIHKAGGMRVVVDGNQIITVYINSRNDNKWSEDEATKAAKRGKAFGNRKGHKNKHRSFRGKQDKI